MPVPITREQSIIESVQRFTRDVLYNQKGYTAAEVAFLDGFPYNLFTGPLDKEYVACSFSMDDGGEQAELGSDLKRKQHTLEFWCFATTGVWGRNLSGAISNAIESAQLLIPLYDITQPDPAPIVDYLLVADRSPKKQQVIVRDPRPWEQNLYLVTVNVIDEYYSASGNA